MLIVKNLEDKPSAHVDKDILVMLSKDATEIHVLTIPVVQMLTVSLEMTPLCVLVHQVMLAIHLIKDVVVK